MPRSRWWLALCFALVGVGLAGALLGARIAVAPGRTVAQSLGGVASEPGAPASAELILVFQYHDCRSLELVFSALNRVRKSYGLRLLSVRGLMLSGPPGRTPAYEGLPADFSVSRASRSGPIVRSLLRLGFRQTPVLLGIDAAGRVRVATPALGVDVDRIAALAAFVAGRTVTVGQAKRLPPVTDHPTP